MIARAHRLLGSCVRQAQVLLHGMLGPHWKGFTLGLVLFGAGLPAAVYVRPILLPEQPAVARAPGDTVEVYGPRTLNSTSNAGTTYIERFTVSVVPGRQYVLRLVNGNIAGTNRVTSAVTTLNGAPVISATELTSSIASVSKVVAIRAVDTLRVTVKGPAGSFVTATVSSIASSEFVVNGPASYGIPAGTSKTHSFVFTKPATAGPPFRLYLTNGDSLGGLRVTNASVKLNGAIVVTTTEFTNAVGSLTKPVTLTASNSVTVTLKGNASKFVTLWFTASDTAAPVIAITKPPVDSIIRTSPVTVTGTISDASPTTVTVNGVQATVTNNTSFSASVPLSTQGNNLLTAIATDAGGRTRQVTRNVIFDSQGPALAVNTPADNSATKDPTVLVTGTVTDATPVTVRTNGTSLPVTGTSFSGTVALAYGANVLTTTATDAAFNTTSVVRNVTRDTVPPVLTVSAPADGATTTSDSITVSGSVTDATAVTVTANMINLPVTSGNFSGKVGLVDGPNTITVVATDAATNSSTVTRTVTRQGDEQVPPDPSTVATPIDPTVATTIGAATAFLYSGANPIQTGVVPGTIEPVRAAVLRGRVLARDGQPLPGVTVSVLGHPELGQTLSRADGMYDLAVNGGGHLMVELEKSGFLAAQRPANPPWQDYAAVDDVILLAADPQVTAIDFSQPMAVARGTPQTDANGTRQATVLFPQGTEATLVLPDGSTQPLSSMHVRATEYTVGPDGPKAMPAPLPPTSAYTYAVELNADEAVAAGAKRVTFSTPVPLYVENFLNLPVGWRVPVGSYDQERGTWVAEDDGRIIKLLSVTGGLADLDTDGDGQPEGSAPLGALGISEPERERLASLYAPGTSLWRAALSHFTTIDLNFPFAPRPGIGPQEPSKKEDEKVTDPCQQSPNSVIECENQVLGERLPVTGTPVTLNYRSDRVPGRRAAYEMQIPLTGETVPEGAVRVVREVSVAGQFFRDSFPPDPGQTTTFRWNGRDAYGRMVQGLQPVEVRVYYIYPYSYSEPRALADLFRSFGLTLDCTDVTCIFTLNPPRGFYASAPVVSRATLGVPNMGGAGLGSWSLSVHHVYDPVERVLYRGDGERVESPVAQIGTVAGNGTTGVTGDGGPANQAALSSIWGIAAGADGSLYLAETGSQRIRRVTPEGMLTTVVGNGTECQQPTAPCGDGGPATGAQLSFPMSVAIGPDGSLYIADAGINRIRRVSPAGIITTVAGTGEHCEASTDPCGDGGPATAARLSNPEAVAVGPDGSLYISDYFDNRIRRVGPDGTIVTVAGTGEFGNTGDGGPATAADIGGVRAIAVGPDGSLYLAGLMIDFDAPSFEAPWAVRRVTPDGIIRTAAYGRDALGSLAVGPDGTVYFGVYSGWGIVDALGTDGVVTRVAGGQEATGGDGGPAVAARLVGGGGLAVGPDGSLYLSDGVLSSSPTGFDRNRVRRVQPVLPGFAVSGTTVASSDGSELYQFDAGGRHLRTFNSFTGATRFSFAYDPAGRLTGITDGDGASTTIERAGNGNPIAIAGPDAHRTTLALDPDGFLQRVEDPAGHAWTADYGTGGLVTRITDPNDHASEYSYNASGQLTGTLDAEGGTKTPARAKQASGFNVGITSGLGVARSYSYEPLPGGASRRVTVDAAGLATTTQFASDGSATTTTSEGMTITSRRAPDARFGMQAPLVGSHTIGLPSGLTATITRGRKTALSDPLNPMSITSQTDSTILNGRVSRSTWTAATRTTVFRSPAGRTGTRRDDEQGRPVEASVPGLTPMTFEYDARGRLTGVAQGPRIAILTYDDAGRIASSTDPASRETRYFYDGSGRLARTELPGGRSILFGHDARGNATSIQPGDRPAHQIAFNNVNIPTSYTPPDVGGGNSVTGTTFNADRRLTQITQADGAEINIGYDAAARPLSITTPSGERRASYSAATGQPTTLTAPGGISLAFGYDGGLPTQEEWSGPVPGRVAVTYNNDMRVASQSVNGAALAQFQYDDDGLLTQAGALSLTRSPLNGLLTGTSLGSLTTSRQPNGFGEMDSQDASVGGNSLFHVTYTYDLLGRIVEATETVQGTTVAMGYTYDPAGSLSEVRRNGTVTAVYGYDANGNRTSLTGPGVSQSATYDNQDRLLTYGGTSYTYTAAGNLLTKTDADGTTSYEHDALGSLTKVTLPTGTVIQYLVDGRSRRIGKRVDGSLVQGLLYQGRLAPVAELDGAGQVISRFVYGTSVSVPEYFVRAGVTYRLVTDHLGSVRLVVNTSNGAVVQRLDYDEFGQVTQNTNPGFQPFGYAGGIYDLHTGFVRFGARDYDPHTGRWTTKDPDEFGGADANLYRYSSGDPINYVDPDGRLPIYAKMILSSVSGGLSASWYEAARNPCLSGLESLKIFGQGFTSRFLGAGYALLAGGKLQKILGKLAVLPTGAVGGLVEGVSDEGFKTNGRFDQSFDELGDEVALGSILGSIVPPALDLSADFLVDFLRATKPVTDAELLAGLKQCNCKGK